MTRIGLPLDEYEAINLLEALRVVPDTGDWYGQVTWKLEGLLRLVAGSNGASHPLRANVPADDQVHRIVQAKLQEAQTRAS